MIVYQKISYSLAKISFCNVQEKKKMFNISEKKLIKDKPLDPYKHVHIHSLKCKFKSREPLIWNLSGKITGNTTVFQNADWTLFSWALWQWQGEFNVTVVEVRDQWMRLTNNMAATPPHRHTICFNDSNACFSSRRSGTTVTKAM